MRIGIDASRAFSPQRTGIEEYAYQVIMHLRDKLGDAQVVLYTRPGIKPGLEETQSLPVNWKLKVIRWPIFWTQIGLSLEMLWHPVDTLFVPAHTAPLIHPKNTVVTIHGLEYEFCPEAYSLWERLYMRWFIKLSCWWSQKIIAVSENTRRDLMGLYNIPEDKIKVVYEGYDSNLKFQISNFKSSFNVKISKPYLLFVGRIENRKNVEGIIEALEILKSRHDIPHKLVLIGKPGYGYKNIKFKVQSSKFKDSIVELGYVDEQKKRDLLHGAEVFLFPSFYEGFGLPILEAQAMGVPVVAANGSSISEVAGKTALLVDPNSVDQIAEATYRLIYDKALKDDIIQKGYSNIKRFSWEECARTIAQLIAN
ncbi:glycosyltransferase family 1 protein [Patescibacteria group bacterium]|nr:MAG: glycosyltransferase family 1 protein [Patescibacteria group bacterium]